LKADEQTEKDAEEARQKPFTKADEPAADKMEWVWEWLVVQSINIIETNSLLISLNI
jgi:hypothetical protein